MRMFPVPSFQFPVLFSALYGVLLSAGVSSASAQEDGRSLEALRRVLGETLEKTAPSVVAIEIDRIKDPEGSAGGGMQAHRDFYNRPHGPVSGLILESDGHIVTTYFNISGELRSISVILHDGSKHGATLLGYDQARDLALLKIEKGDLPVLPPAVALRQGHFTAIVGRSPDPSVPTITHGILSASSRHNATAVQIDAELNFGNVGGAVVTLEGELIGMASHIRPREPWGQSSGVGFATPLPEIAKVLTRLKAGEKILKTKEAWIGFAPGEGNSEREGIEVSDVFPDTPASKVGLQSGEVISHLDGEAVADVEDLKYQVQKKGIGARVTLTVHRKGETGWEERKVEVTLEENPN